MRGFNVVNAKTKWIYAVRCMSFALVTALLLLYASSVLSNGTDNHKFLFQDFYKASKNEVDVVYIGASGASWNWNPTVAFRETGLASQLLASERCPADAMPYLLAEAAKKDPALYVVDVHRFLGATSGDLAAVQSVLVNLRWSRNRLDAADDMLENYSEEEKIMKYSPLYFFHSRWNQLGARDFETVPYDFMGFSMRALSGSGIPAGAESAAAEPAAPKEEQLENLNLFLEKCRGLRGKILFVEAPNDGSLAQYERYIQNLVTQMGCDYLNASEYIDEIGMEDGDYQGGHHLTVYGAEKYTVWLSQYLERAYGIPDRREESGFREKARYEQQYEAYQAYKISHGVMLHKYLESVASPRYCVLIAVKDEASSGLDERDIEKLRNLGFIQTPAGVYRASYAAAESGGELIDEKITAEESGESVAISGILPDGTPFSLESGGYKASNHASVCVDGKEYSVNGRGLNIVVYDNLDHKVIDSAAFDTFLSNKPVTR